MKPNIAIITSCLAALLSHSGVAAAKSCPEELPGQVQLTGSDLIFHYGILSDEGVLCGKLESKSKAWVAFGAQPEGKNSMVGAHAIIALPNEKTVQQYLLNSKSNSGINLLSEEAQTLTETSVTQRVRGGTVARFKQPLDFNGLKLTSKNVYMLAMGTSNELGYQKNRGFVTLDFEKNISIASMNDESEQGQSLSGQAIYSTLE